MTVTQDSNIRDDAREWADSGAGTVAIRLVRDIAHRDTIIETLHAEVRVLDGRLDVWADPGEAARLMFLTPDESCVAVLVNPGQEAAWALWLNANREALRDWLVFLVALLFEDSLTPFALAAPDFMSGAKEHGIAWASDGVLTMDVSDLEAECHLQHGCGRAALVARWRAGAVEDTAENSALVALGAILDSNAQPTEKIP